MEYPPVVAHFVPKLEVDNVVKFILLEKHKSWMEGFEAARAIALYEKELQQ